MLTIDGAMGEGGGQIIRSALALSMVTSTPFRIENIRANRPKPGLMRQHLTSVEAARSVCSGRVEGASLGSTSLSFIPGDIRGGEFNFSIGTAGSTTLVLQTVLPVLMRAGEPSTISLSGGTHNTHAPSIHFLRHAYLPLINRMGPSVELELTRHGFYPAGGGHVRASIEPSRCLTPFELVDTGPIKRRSAVATIAGLPPSIAKREIDTLAKKLGWPSECFSIRQLKEGEGPGNIISVKVEREGVTEVFTGFGERGVSAEQVAQAAAKDVKKYLATDVPVWRYLADQLLLPLALAGGGSFRTGPLSRHALTNAAIIELFLDVKVNVTDQGDQSCLVRLMK